MKLKSQMSILAAIVIICGALITPSYGNVKDIHLKVREPLNLTQSLLKIDPFKEIDVTRQVINIIYYQKN